MSCIGKKSPRLNTPSILRKIDSQRSDISLVPEAQTPSIFIETTKTETGEDVIEQARESLTGQIQNLKNRGGQF